MKSKNMTFLILGGYGNDGRLIAELLLNETDVQINLAGRSLAKADDYAHFLNEKYHGSRVSSVKVDAANSESLKAAFQLVDCVIVASSTID